MTLAVKGTLIPEAYCAHPQRMALLGGHCRHHHGGHAATTRGLCLYCLCGGHQAPWDWWGLLRGWLFFRERHLSQRLLGVSVMAAGVFYPLCHPLMRVEALLPHIAQPL